MLLIQYNMAMFELCKDFYKDCEAVSIKSFEKF